MRERQKSEFQLHVEMRQKLARVEKMCGMLTEKTGQVRYDNLRQAVRSSLAMEANWLRAWKERQ